MPISGHAYPSAALPYTCLRDSHPRLTITIATPTPNQIRLRDWFHESCLNLRERVPPRETAESDADPFPSNAQPAPLDQTQGGPPPEQTERAQVQSAPPAHTGDAPLVLGQIQDAPPAQDGNEQDAESVYSSASLPPALLPGDSYETLICGSCVGKIPTVKRYAGTKGFRMVVPAEGGVEGLRILGEEWDEEVEVDVVGEEGQEVGTKRRASDAGADEQASKRPRAEDPNPTPTDTPSSFNDTSTSTPDDPIPPTRCTAPPINSLAQTFLADPTAYGDVFLSAGWRERWCRCETCYPSLLKHPFLLEEEETYEPPQDPDAGLSLEELGMRALATLPHERALDSIRAYNAMRRDDLMLYLRPFADSGREVREEDITAFFQRRRQGRV
ncbi:PHD zinc finger, partial [Rhizoctonia solani]